MHSPHPSHSSGLMYLVPDTSSTHSALSLFGQIPIPSPEPERDGAGGKSLSLTDYMEDIGKEIRLRWRFFAFTLFRLRMTIPHLHIEEVLGRGFAGWFALLNAGKKLFFSGRGCGLAFVYCIFDP